MGIRSAIAVLVALGLALQPGSSSSAATPQALVVSVGQGGDYAGLEAALASVADGTVLELLPGVHRGRWVIDRPLTLRGSAGTILDGGGEGTLLTITASSVTIEDLTIQATGRSLLNDDAAILVEGDDARIINNHLLDIHHAIFVSGGAARALIRGNSIQGRAELIREDRGNGIHLWDAPDTVVEDNVVLDVRDGIYVGFAPGSLFRNNSFKRVRYGIHFMYADNNTFEDNIFEWSEAGAALMYSKNIVLRRNIFAHSRSSRAYGLLLQECSAVWAENNVIVDNSRGLFINVSSDGIFKNNIFLGNDLALQIYSAAENNAIVGNDFIGNLQLIELDQAGSNWWDGNYWDGYKGADFDGDGVGDSPFRTRDPLGTLILDHPQLRLFRYGPGVEALELAEQSFPVMDIPEIVDLNPAMAPIAGRTAYIPELPADRTQSRWGLAIFGGMSLLLALTIARAGRPHRKGSRR